MIQVKLKRLHHDAILPHQGTEGSVGYDLHAYILSSSGRPDKKIIGAKTTMNIPTGIAIEAPDGYFTAVCSRSGLAKDSLSVCNSPGIVDPDYRGEIRVLLYNGGYEWRTIHHEDRIAQLVFFPAIYANLIEVPELSQTERGEKGLGSTGGVSEHTDRSS
jgi:dUTP pyrophosphatase